MTVARAYLDQLARSGTMRDHIAQLSTELARIEGLPAGERQTPLMTLAGQAAGMRAHVTGVDAMRLQLLSETLTALAR